MIGLGESSRSVRLLPAHRALRGDIPLSKASEAWRNTAFAPLEKI